MWKLGCILGLGGLLAFGPLIATAHDRGRVHGGVVFAGGHGLHHTHSGVTIVIRDSRIGVHAGFGHSRVAPGAHFIQRPPHFVQRSPHFVHRPPHFVTRHPHFAPRHPHFKPRHPHFKPRHPHFKPRHPHFGAHTFRFHHGQPFGFHRQVPPGWVHPDFRPPIHSPGIRPHQARPHTLTPRGIAPGSRGHIHVR
jgi:hypothetical protein